MDVRPCRPLGVTTTVSWADVVELAVAALRRRASLVTVHSAIDCLAAASQHASAEQRRSLAAHGVAEALCELMELQDALDLDYRS